MEISQMSTYIQRSQASFQAWVNSSRNTETAAKKQEIIDSLESHHNTSPISILFMGFSSFLFAQYNANLYVTDVDEQILDYLKTQNITVTHIPRQDLITYKKKFQVTVAVDEFFTYASTDQEQRELAEMISNLTTDYAITTLRDYKNQDYRDREFSQPVLLRDNNDIMIFVESHVADLTDRSKWASSIYQITTPANELHVYGPYDRRAMYFKQLAKFSIDAGATNFLVHKNLMYKSLTKRNYEHVITIKFN